MSIACKYCQIVLVFGTRDADKCAQSWGPICCNCLKDKLACTQQAYDSLGCRQCKQRRQQRQTGAPVNIPAAATGAEPSMAANNEAARLIQDATAHAARIVADMAARALLTGHPVGLP
eukprot:CAMPEP_0173062834 /NCGR_PEP_ID=MMETSP1102-20130122/4030_1 /TAXON_ID=49646 /ORGANISM="Geminigera sp., Strain Caron Lab Isolate" /LENGTH=117 /DNA_ID=CAMNT_0013929533 /DNA_START=432 /DNA_END=785 /DNA_ORIENTATION=-